MKTSSVDLFKRAEKVIPGGVHSPVRALKGVGVSPLFFEKADGALMESVEGKKSTVRGGRPQSRLPGLRV